MRKIVLSVLLICLFSLTSCGKDSEIEKVDLDSINVIDYSEASKLDIDLHSRGYLLMRLNDLHVLYSENIDEEIYPASLTKIVTLDTVLNLCKDLDEKSRIEYYQMDELIRQDASVAYLTPEKNYTIEELLYALVLPSGGDAAVALENYFEDHGMNLVDEMNKRVNELGCEHSHFVNATGMHSDNHYTSLNDLLAVTIYCMKYQSGREILETLNYINSDGNVYSSTVNYLAKHNVEILGGKTGFTTQAGQLIMVLYRKDNRSYLLMLSNSDGDNYTDTYYHYEDCINIFERLYN